MRFVFQCFANPPEFIHKHLPCYDDEDVEETAAASEVTANSKSDNSSVAPAESSNSSCNDTAATAVATNSNLKSSNSCECYRKLCLSVVYLLYQCMEHWMAEEKLNGNRVIDMKLLFKLAILNNS